MRLKTSDTSGNLEIVENSSTYAIISSAKEVKKAYIGVEGKAKNFWSEIKYIWKKYNVIDNSYYDFVVTDTVGEVIRVGGIPSCEIWNKRPIIDSKTGVINKPDYYTSGKEIYQSDLTNIYTDLGEKFNIYYYVNEVSYNKPGHITNDKYWIKTKYNLRKQHFPSYSKGSYIADVSSENPNEYPEDGRASDGYWYVKQTE